MALPWPVSRAMPGVPRWAAPETMRGMAQLAGARRASHRQRRRAHHAKERAVEAGELESARSDNAGAAPEQRSLVARRAPPVEPEVPSATRRAAQENLPPRPLSKLSPTPPPPCRRCRSSLPRSASRVLALHARLLFSRPSAAFALTINN